MVTVPIWFRVQIQKTEIIIEKIISVITLSALAINAWVMF